MGLAVRPNARTIPVITPPITHPHCNCPGNEVWTGILIRKLTPSWKPAACIRLNSSGGTYNSCRTASPQVRAPAVLTTLGAWLLGLLLGMRHALEPDHLAAVSTLAVEHKGRRAGM